MTAILRALVAGIGWQGWLGLALAGALLAAIVMVRNADRAAGALKERERIERANRATGNAADGAERDVLACPAGQWSREAGRCAPR